MLLELPEEIIFEILEKLSLKHLSVVACVSHILNRMANEDALWKRELVEIHPKKDEAHPLPGPRLCHVAVVWKDCMYIHGGHNTNPGTQQFHEIKRDFHCFSFETRQWTPIQASLPSKTEHSAVVYDSKMWLFGGYSGSSFTNSLYMYDFVTNECTLVNGVGDIPSERSAHVGVVHKDCMYIFAGWNGHTQNNDLYRFHFASSTWTKIEPKGPAPHPRCSHTAVVSSGDNAFYVFGGYGGKVENYLCDLWRFNFATEEWENISAPGTKPVCRSRMKMLEWNGELYTFGGWDKQQHFNDFFVFDTRTQTWSSVNMIHNDDYHKIGQHSMCIYNGTCYIFAGFNNHLRTSSNIMFGYRLSRQPTAP